MNRLTPVPPILGVLLFAGCSGAEDPPAPALEDPVSDSQEVRDEGEADTPRLPIDELRALGYIGFTEDEEADASDGVFQYDEERACPGYTLIVSGDLALAELLDLEGRVVHEWRGESAGRWSHAELQPNGDIVVPANYGGKRGLDRIRWSGGRAWRSEARCHHDSELQPDGSFVCLTTSLRRIPAIDSDVDVKDHAVSRLSSNGRELESLSIYDLLEASPDVFRFQRVARMKETKRDVIDLLHSNSVELMDDPKLVARSPIYALGNAMVSIRHQDTVAIFDLDRGRTVWAWGQGELSGQHDATMLDNGHVLIFDNGLEKGWSRILEVDPIEERIVWRYGNRESEDFFSLRRGSAQRLPNGNTLIGNSDSGEAFEITPEGDRVWQYRNPNLDSRGRRSTIIRAKRYPREMIDPLLKSR